MKTYCVAQTSSVVCASQEWRNASLDSWLVVMGSATLFAEVRARGSKCVARPVQDRLVFLHHMRSRARSSRSVRRRHPPRPLRGPLSARIHGFAPRSLAAPDERGLRGRVSMPASCARTRVGGGIVIAKFTARG